MEDWEMTEKYLEEIIKPLMKNTGLSLREAVNMTYYKVWCPRCEDFFGESHKCFGGSGE